MDHISFEKDDEVDVSWLINQLFFSFPRRKRFDEELWWSKIRFVVKIFRSRLLAVKISFKYKWDSAFFQQGSFENWKKIDQKPYFHKSFSALTKLQYHSCNINLSNSDWLLNRALCSYSKKHNTLCIRKTRHSMNTYNV